jgi:segregation and condensation protein A
MPDWLEGVTLYGLAVVCADLEHRRERFLLEAEHVASMPISLELHAESVARTLAKKRQAMFSELLEGERTPELVVVTLLAVLELYKRHRIDVEQSAPYADIALRYLSDFDHIVEED